MSFTWWHFIFLSDKPSPPRNVRVTEYHKDHMVVCWDVPENDGGSNLTGYTVEKRDMKRAAFVKAGAVNGTTLTLKVTRLVEGNEYLFRVCAENDIGTSDWATMDEAVKAKLPFGKNLSSYFILSQSLCR